MQDKRPTFMPTVEFKRVYFSIIFYTIISVVSVVILYDIITFVVDRRTEYSDRENIILCEICLRCCVVRIDNEIVRFLWKYYYRKPKVFILTPKTAHFGHDILSKCTICDVSFGTIFRYYYIYSIPTIYTRSCV